MVGPEGTEIFDLDNTTSIKVFDLDNARSMEKALSGKELHQELLLLTRKY